MPAQFFNSLILMLSSKPSGNLSESVFVDGFRFYGDTDPALVQSAAQALRAPEQTLRALSTRLEISFSNRMLHWPAGPRDSDGVWARHWYAAVESSTGFQPVSEAPLSDVAVPPNCEQMRAQAEDFYARLHQYALNG